jgi:hypothetical protein
MTRGKTILLATAVAGTLDLLSAFAFSALAPQPVGPGVVMRFVASGPLGNTALDGDSAYVLAGFIVHYAIMTCMAAAYVLIAPSFRSLFRRPLVAGTLYGLFLWVIMYWIVRPLRWPGMYPHSLLGVVEAWFSHIVCVGLPIAFIAWRNRSRA